MTTRMNRYVDGSPGRLFGWSSVRRRRAPAETPIDSPEPLASPFGMRFNGGPYPVVQRALHGLFLPLYHPFYLPLFLRLSHDLSPACPSGRPQALPGSAHRLSDGFHPGLSAVFAPGFTPVHPAGFTAAYPATYSAGYPRVSRPLPLPRATGVNKPGMALGRTASYPGEFSARPIAPHWRARLSAPLSRRFARSNSLNRKQNFCFSPDQTSAQQQHQVN